MTKEQKDLLIKDLCSRLPYRVVVDYAHNAFDVHKGHYVKQGSKCILNCYLLDVFLSPRQNENGEYIKPYLFPIESMSEEQKKEYNRLKHDVSVCHYEYGEPVEEIELYDSPESFEYLIENKFDYYGLIPMGLANDATNLNIYRL